MSEEYSDKILKLIDRYYPVLKQGLRFRNGTAPFYDWILSMNNCSSATVLNVGAGPTPPENRRLRGKVGRLVGVDPDPSVLQNKDLDEAFVADGVQLPFPDRTFDYVYSDWTVEHVPDPRGFLQEIHRVLKPGGSYFFRTPNLFHYVTLISDLTPQWFHRLVANRARKLSNDHHEPWPTYYRLNSRGRISKELEASGFRSVEIRQLESFPSYLVFHPLMFRLGVAYERLVNRYAWLSGLRQIILARAIK